MTTEAVVTIKGRNDLGYAVKQAEQQLKGLVRTGDLLGKALRGGAIVGAALAFERLAQNAEEAANAVGDKGTARSLHLLNKTIDELKNKGTNIIGKVLGNVYSIATNDTLGKLNEQIEFLKNNLSTGFVSLAYGRIGTGVFTVAETRAKLAELEKIKKMYDDNLRYGERSRAPGSHAGGTAVDNYGVTPPKDSASPGLSDIYIRESLHQITTLSMAQDQAFKEMDDSAKHFSLEFSADMANGYADTARELEALTKETESATSEWTVYADQAARNMQDAFAQFLFDPFHDGLKGMLKSFIDTMRQMIAQAAAARIFQLVGNWIGGAWGGAMSGSAAGATFSGPRAMGGPVSKGHVYTVGEQGKETFIPSTNGYILPNGAGGGITINQHVDASGADADKIMAIMPGLLKQTKDQTIAEIRDLQRRGRM